jgi:hypothetical protein
LEIGDFRICGKRDVVSLLRCFEFYQSLSLAWSKKQPKINEIQRAEDGKSHTSEVGDQKSARGREHGAEGRGLGGLEAGMWDP